MNFTFAQSIEAIKADRNNYIWGEGKGKTLKEADQQALGDIISQISTQVESSFERVVTESDDKFKESVKDVLNTYSSATLKNTERIVLSNEPEAVIFRYIKRDEVQKVFESRKNKVIEFAKNGYDALQENKIADALRYFYWAQTLLRSHPSSAEIRFSYKDVNDVMLTAWLPVTINSIFSGLSLQVSKVDTEENLLSYIIQIRYKDQDVRNLDYSYWSGQDWTNSYCAKDGTGIAEFQQRQDEIRFRIEYEFESEANIDMELRDVIQKVTPVTYKNCYTTIKTKIAENKTTIQNPTLAVSQQSNVSNEKNSNAVYEQKTSGNQAVAGMNEEVKKEIAVIQPDNSQVKAMNRIIAALKVKQYSSLDDLFTSEGLDVFRKLIQYGNAKVLKSDNLKYYHYSDFVICRPVTMSFSFNNNNRVFVEDVVFYFDTNNKICNLTFGLSKEAIQDITSKPWPENTLMLLISFMENYQTAYALKRLDYINKIFSDDALIIIGSVSNVKVNTTEFKYSDNSIVKYNRISKTNYMRNLEHCFKSNEFINIRFADNTIKQAAKNQFYGIQIKQDYFSTNYGDSGYLFLLIDMTDTINPQIQVRTWQPEKNPDGSVIGPEDFNF